MTATPCDFPAALLLSYRAGELRAAQLEIVDTHLRACNTCRAWLTDLDDVQRAIRAGVRVADDPLGRARLKDRIAMLPPPRPPELAMLRHRHLLLVVIALAAALGLGGVWSSGAIVGGSSFSAWWRDREPIGGNVPSERVGPTAGASAPVQPLEAPSLPLGLARIAGGRSEAELIEQRFQNADGLVISVTADRSGRSWLSPAGNEDDHEIVGLDGRDVLVVYGASRDRVAALSWVAGDTLYLMFVEAEPPGGLHLADGLAIVRALMDQPLDP
jgi:hypothetical protein